MRIALFLALFTMMSPLHAQSVELGGASGFNPLAISTFSGSEAFTFDQAFADVHGIPVPAPITLNIPRHDGLHIHQTPAPDSGAAMVFVFSQDAAPGQERLFLEDLQIVRFNLPLYEDSADPVHERRDFAAGYFQAELFPQWIARYPDAEIFAIEEIDLGNSEGALQLVAGYTDHEYDETMMLRAVVLPQAGAVEGYLALTNINLDRVPVTDPQTLAATVTGRILSDWQYQ